MREKNYAETLKIRKKILQEEEDEERELTGYYQKLEGMRESCHTGDWAVGGLIEEQMELLNALREEKARYLAEWEKKK